MKDTQDRKPDVGGGLDRVGVTNLKTPIQTTWGGRRYYFTPKVEMTIDLGGDRKGVHMSRLIESITEAVGEGSKKPGRSIEEVERRILDVLSRRHRFRRGEIMMETDMVLQRKTPVTGRKTAEVHEIEVAVSKEGRRYYKRLKVRVLGNTVCPHSMEACGRPHIQRAVGELTVESGYDVRVDLEDMVACVEKSFSAEVYTLLKTGDESRIVEEMHSNPKFVEDVTRGIISNARRKFRGCGIKARTVSNESIHRHDVVAEGSAGGGIHIL